MSKHKRPLSLFTLLLMLVIVGQAFPAHAFKPYTHNKTGDSAREDAIDDGYVTINGQLYPVRHEIRAALTNWPAFYNAGVVGPDGFPDLTYGQSVIHPFDPVTNVGTGMWMRYLYEKAWEAQSNPSYSTDEKSQILAFTYGYLTHAAGDMWAHTLVNDFAKEVFPAVGDIISDSDDAAVALRHIIVEGYIGDATAGYDGNPARGHAPNNDTSDDSTPGIDFNAPHRFLYNTLVNPNAPTPSASRGPLIGFFLELRGTLADVVSDSPQPLQAALEKYKGLEESLNALENDCNFGTTYEDADDIAEDILHDIVACPAGLAELGFKVTIKTAEAFAAFVTETLKKAAEPVYDAYLNAWIQDIDAGLENWSKLGLASTKALFDPQARRNAQNDICHHLGEEDDHLRIECEEGIGAVDVLLREADPFIKDHLLSMLGAPDATGDVLTVLQDFAATLDALSVPFNPIREGLAQIKEEAKEKVKAFVKDAYGIDVDQLKDFLTHPTHWLNVGDVTITLPSGQKTLHLFDPGDHTRLDQILGLDDVDHHDSASVLGQTSSKLKDDVAFDPNEFPVFKNTVTTAKLLLLDGPALNQVLGDFLHAQGRINAVGNVATYPAAVNGFPSNIMLHGLDLNPSDNLAAAPWLKSIDSDHPWRHDGLPRFCTIGTAGCPTDPNALPTPREADHNGGNGNFPIWESCLLRPAFRGLYTDWENNGQNFPDLGDDVSADPSDPDAPSSSISVTPKYEANSNTYIPANNVFTLSASDTVFQDSQLAMQYRVYKDGSTPGDWITTPNGATFSIPTSGGDGIYHVDFRAEDPCHRFAQLPTSAMQTKTFILDTTPPTITYTSPNPEGVVFDTDDLSSIGFTLDDGQLGSGVKTHTVTLDNGAVANGHVLDMFYLEPGTHTIVVNAWDNLDNASNATRTFKVEATSVSICSNVDRAWSLKLITDAKVYKGLKDKCTVAINAHKRGQHFVEHEQLTAFILQLEAQRGKGIDLVTANRFIRYARDLISRGA